MRPELVVEVRYDKVQGHRFRHGTKLIRWRDDKNPADCTWREVRPPREAGAGVEALLAQPLDAGEPELLEPRAQRGRAAPHALHRVARLGDPRRHRANGERGGIDRGDLVPAQRCRDARVRRRPHRVGRRRSSGRGRSGRSRRRRRPGRPRATWSSRPPGRRRAARPPRRAPSQSGAPRETAAPAGSARARGSPVAPDVFGYERRPSSSITSRTTRAISRTNGHWPSLVGSRSISR